MKPQLERLKNCADSKKAAYVWPCPLPYQCKTPLVNPSDTPHSQVQYITAKLSQSWHRLGDLLVLYSEEKSHGDKQTAAPKTEGINGRKQATRSRVTRQLLSSIWWGETGQFIQHGSKAWTIPRQGQQWCITRLHWGRAGSMRQRLGERQSLPSSHPQPSFPLILCKWGPWSMECSHRDF